MRSESGPRVAIVGAGFSGTMLAVHLRRAGASVTLIDRRGRFAEGLAYSTTDDVHLLNVRAGNMSAFPDEPDHFAKWLEARAEGDRAAFARRLSYRIYLAEIWAEVSEGVRCIADEATAVDGLTLKLASSEDVDVDAIVVAMGNLAPAPFRGLAAADLVYVNDPWSADGRARLAVLAQGGESVLVLGTGLTMVDTVLAFEARGFAGRIIALSRRGQIPEPHAAFAPGDVSRPTVGAPHELLRWARGQALGNDWRAVVDSLRPNTVAIWRSWSVQQRSRFLRHLRPWWDVRRHRIAPQVWQRLQRLIAQGRLDIRAGRVVRAHEGQVFVRYRGDETEEPLAVAGAVNCTGPQGDIRKARASLIQSLLDAGEARTDAFGLGFDVDEDCRTIAADGGVRPGLYAIGPMTRGAFWEMVAVPDIRVQAQALAATIIADARRTLPASAWHAASAAR